MHRTFRAGPPIILASLLLLTLAAVRFSSPLRAQDAPPPESYTFPETGYTVSGRFLQFWRNQGGLAVFGLPLSEQAASDNSETLQVQWFERERFELHPENAPPYDVQLGRLGAEALERAGRNWYSFPQGTPTEDCLFFEATSHTLCEPFLSYWRANGLEFDGEPGTSYAESLALFGMPLSEPAMETNSSDQTVLTQWFERARFEYVPTNPAPFQVLLGRLGAELLEPEPEPEPEAPQPTEYHSIQDPLWPAPLEVPVGFTVEEVARDLNEPRFMALDQDGSLVYGTQGPGIVGRLRDTNNDGFYETQQTIATGLTVAHSVAFIGGELFAAAENEVVRLADFDTTGRAQTVQTVIANIPDGARDLYGHRTRTLLPGPDGYAYLSVGSPCDVCEDVIPQRAAVLRTPIENLSAGLDAAEMEVFASGLRNTVGLDFHPDTGALWGMDMGRNNLGDDLPPEELNLIERGKNYGWPYCFGNQQPDPQFNDPARCQNTTPPRVTFPAHWAPLGVAFYDRESFPASYRGDALIAFHGSAADQTDERLGYRVTRVRFDEAGQPQDYEDLLRGFIVPETNEPWARPAGVLVAPDGSVLISDDFGGRIFRVRYTGDED